MVLSVNLLPIFSTEPNDVIEIRIIGEHSKCVCNVRQRTKRFAVTSQLSELPFQIINSSFQLFECHCRHITCQIRI